MDGAVNNEWFTCGWHQLLPRQAFPLHMLVASATVHDLDGGLDSLLEQMQFGANWNMLYGGLDAAPLWTLPEDNDDREQIEFDTTWQDRFTTTMQAAGRPLPTTVRDLAGLMAELGVFEREATGAGERWRSPDVLPVPEDILPLAPDLAADLGMLRWNDRIEPYVQELIRYLIELDEPAELATSVQRLARATGLDEESVRQGLAGLVADGDLRVVRGEGPQETTADPERLAEHARCRLLVDWEHFHEHRIGLRKA